MTGDLTGFYECLQKMEKKYLFTVNFSGFFLSPLVEGTRFVHYLDPASAAESFADSIKYTAEPLCPGGVCVLVGPVCASNVSLFFSRKFRFTLESAHIVNVLISQLRI